MNFSEIRENPEYTLVADSSPYSEQSVSDTQGHSGFDEPPTGTFHVENKMRKTMYRVEVKNGQVEEVEEL